jgi:large subunit ribosomal protein L6e
VRKQKWYKADDGPINQARRTPRAPKLRSSIQPGRVLILLAGRFRGKRVIALKQLKSGLVAVTGPYKVNGVPIRRVNQAYTISTSTTVDIKGVNTDKITDETFANENRDIRSREHRFLAENAPKNSVSDVRKALQKEVDTALLKNISDKVVRKYLGARFTLGKHDAPHAMKF